MAEPIRIRRALISVYDKTGIVDFARTLHEEFGVEIISTGGTAKTLQDAGIPVTMVEQVTGFPEMMDGRVKTLHPKIHAGILADRDNPEHMRQLKEQGIEPIDMVVVNLYPFEKTIANPDCTFEEAIEMIDIGGPCLLRAAAKNHRHVLVCTGELQQAAVLSLLRGENDEEPEVMRRDFAQGAFWETMNYDAFIEEWLSLANPEGGRSRFLRLFNADRLRYGENPHQDGEYLMLYDDPRCNALAAKLGQAETEVSFNNFADASAALELCTELTRANQSEHEPSACAVCFIKHTNACGTATDADPIEAYRKAYRGDPNAAMGGILAVNFHVDATFATAVMETYQRWGKPLKEAGEPFAPGAFFVEVWLAPSFDENAVRIIRGEVEGGPKKAWGKRVRLLDVGDIAAEPHASEMDIKRIAGGVLMQSRDLVGLNEDEWKVVTERQPTDKELDDLRLAWLVCKHTKSNAITICRDGALLGNGAGQMSRVMSCRIATWLAKENGHADALDGAVAASDAFFPFRDGPDILADAGVTALIQPGGSKRDADTIAACNERGLAMIFTGVRHFRH